MDNKNTPQILQVGKLIGIPDGNVLSCCPRMDLMAISMNKTSVWMFRFNGERVYSINNKARILELQWNSSGKFFAVSGTDNLIKIYETNTGALVNKFATNTSLPITLMNWVSVELDASIGSDKAAPFLKMFKQDILKQLPKLSHEVNFYDSERAGGVISMQSGSSKAQSVSISATNTNEDDSLLDFLLVINAYSLLTATFNNLFVVPDIELPEGSEFFKHVMRKNFFEQYLLAEQSQKFFLYKMEFEMSEAHERAYILDILKWSSLLVSMLNHITDQVSVMQQEASAFYSLQDRYLSNLKEAFVQGEDNLEGSEISLNTLVTFLIDMVLLGTIPSYLEDYWLNQFGERGLQRLSKGGNELYDATRKTTFAQVILAVEKILVLLSDLRGVCITGKNIYQNTYGMAVDTLELAVESSKSLLKGFYELIWKFNDEQELFNVFCNYVKVEVLELLSKKDGEMELFLKAHPEVEVSSSKTISFIDKHLTLPILVSYLDLDVSGFDVITKLGSEQVSLIAKLTALKTVINQTLLPGIQNFVADRAKFDITGSIDGLGSANDCEMIFNDDGILVSSKTDSILSLTKFYENGKQATTEIKFPNTIMSYKITQNMQIVVLLKIPEKHSELVTFKVPQRKSRINYQDLEKERLMFFDNTSTVKNPTVMTLTQDPFSSRSTGCIFDMIERRYVIFRC